MDVLIERLNDLVVIFFDDDEDDDKAFLEKVSYRKIYFISWRTISFYSF